MAKSKPAPLRERDITRHIAREYYKEFDQLIESDVIIVGAGPSGLICAHDLATMGFRTLIVEQSLALGGGFWHGGYLMNKATICEPANEILEEIGVPCKRIKECEGMYMVDPPHATGALVAAAYRAGAKVLNLTRVVDLILRQEGVLEGVVVNNTTAEMAGHDIIHVDPIALESKVVVDATGHDAVVVELLHKRRLYQPVPGNGAMWVSRSEEEVMNRTGEVYPNCFVIGLAVAAVNGTPRMGPAFGSMLLSGRYGAELIKKKLKQE
ncbi:MAG TPA: sulfide-dependent adenosine diphosphate thiazole synthase [Nitrospiraceae bacterium]|nr:sulfide-dependent adenosine diphosphate thiazole synthase [Nitrospiraceae bacterium]